MIKLLLISLCFLGITPNVKYVHKNSTHKVVYYTKDKKLTWDDFTVINNTSKLDVSESVTQIDIDINYENDVVSEVLISCLLLKDESWVLKKQMNNYILNHEQRHFDIAYIYSIRLIKSLNGISSESEINNIYDNCIKGMTLCQEQYDNETNHSINVEKQKEWDNKINSWLELSKN